MGCWGPRAEKTFVRNRLRITDEFKHLKKSLLYIICTEHGPRPRKLRMESWVRTPFKMNNLVYATFKEVSFCIHFCHWWGLCVQYIICTEHCPRPRKLLMESWVRIPLIIAANNGGLVWFALVYPSSLCFGHWSCWSCWSCWWFSPFWWFHCPLFLPIVLKLQLVRMM